MFMCRKRKPTRAHPYSFIDRGVGKKLQYKADKILLSIFALLLVLSPGIAAKEPAGNNVFPIEMESVISALSMARMPDAEGAAAAYPRRVTYKHVTYDMIADKLNEETRTVVIEEKPTRIISHAVGITEILWAICPRDRIVAYHETCKNPEFSFIAHMLPPSATCFGTQDAEIVIGYNPDLVLTTYYSSPEFVERLDSASIKYVETGYFGSVSSIERQILLIGELIGEKANAVLLVEKMEKYIDAAREFSEKRSRGKRLRVIYYDARGYVPGLNTTFDSMCEVLDIVNIPAGRHLKGFQQASHEQILKWNPDVIIVPEESNLQQRLYGEKVLQTTKAVQQRNIKTIPLVYLYGSSQYIAASVNYLAGILYAQQPK